MNAPQRLGPDEWRVFREIRLDMLASDPLAYGSTLASWQVRPEADIRRWLGELAAFAIVDEGQCLSVAAWHRIGGAITHHRGAVISAYTRPEARGRGLFRAVMAAIETDARAQGVTQLELDNSAANLRAARAYAALGYVEVGRIPDALNHDGRRSDSVILVKRLQIGDLGQR